MSQVDWNSLGAAIGVIAAAIAAGVTAYKRSHCKGDKPD